MDTHYTHHLDFDFLSAQVGESSSDSWNARRLNLPDEEVLLASSSPKKRAGRKKFKETRHPVYRGVRTSHAGKWVCEAREPNKKTRIWLGTYPTADMAARAHDVAAIALRGRSACLNFADSVWRLPMPASKEAKDIQKAAAEAAEAFRPSELEKKGSKVSESVGAEAVGSENLFNMDEEEAMFGLGMPGLLADMAEGMLLPPPHSVENGYVEKDDMEVDANVSLWSYSV